MKILAAILVAYTILYFDDEIDKLRDEINNLKVKIEQIEKNDTQP